MNQLIIEKLKSYELKTASDEQNAIKEITQEIILYALSKTSFFDNAHFCGGTALRINYGLNRFSEDLEFTTNKSFTQFHFDDYMFEVLDILKEYGLDMKVKKSKDDSFVKARELKEDSEKWKLTFPSNRKLKKVIIKLEIDTNPPKGAIEETKRLDFPILHQIKIGTIETLLAGKVHALLCRKYIKGRDWYDLLWYVKKNTSINFTLLTNALYQMGPYAGQNLNKVDKEFVKQELSKKILELNWKDVVGDVERFIKPMELETLSLWDKELFLDRVSKI